MLHVEAPFNDGANIIQLKGIHLAEITALNQAGSDQHIKGSVPLVLGAHALRPTSQNCAAVGVLVWAMFGVGQPLIQPQRIGAGGVGCTIVDHCSPCADTVAHQFQGVACIVGVD